MNVSLSTTCKTKNGFLLIETFSKTKLWPPGNGWLFLFMVRFCTVRLREVSFQSLRDTTYIFIEGFDKLTNIEDLLWQAGLRQSSSKPPKNRNLAPQLLPPELWGSFLK
jgi:hypothetical protein